MYGIVTLGATLLIAVTASAQEHRKGGPAAAPGPSYAEKAVTVDKLFAFVDETGPGCSVNVVKDGVSIFKKSYGVLKKGEGVPATPDTRYLLASSTKPVVALGILKLREELLAKGGSDLLKVRLEEIFHKRGGAGDEKGGPRDRDEKVGIFRDENLNRRTVFDLLTHSTGLGGTYRYQGPGLSDQSLVERIASNSSATYFAGGKRHYYSNSGYAMLGAIIERLSGNSLHGYLQSRFFGPLGMTRTSIHHPQAYVAAKDVAWGHDKNGAVQPFVDDASGTLGDGGLFSTVEDLEKLAVGIDAMEAGKSPILGAASLELAFRSPGFPEADYSSGTLVDGAPVNYGLGWRVEPAEQPVPPLPHVRYQQWHGGSYGGNRAMIARTRRVSPPCRLSVLLLCNTETVTPSDLVEPIEDLYCPR